MKNIRLNAGGLIGSLVAIMSVFAVAAMTSSSPDGLGGRIGGLGPPALFLGAFGGNYLWERFFRKEE